MYTRFTCCICTVLLFAGFSVAAQKAGSAVPDTLRIQPYFFCGTKLARETFSKGAYLSGGLHIVFADTAVHFYDAWAGYDCAGCDLQEAYITAGQEPQTSKLRGISIGYWLGFERLRVRYKGRIVPVAGTFSYTVAE